VTIAVWVLSLLLIAEFVMAPINLWTGRTMPMFVAFTGYDPRVGTRVFAPVKLVGAVLIAVGLALPATGIVGAALTVVVCAVYLVRLVAPRRRNATGTVAFAIFGSWAVALLLLLILR
jgi:hypothetical protein